MFEKLFSKIGDNINFITKNYIWIIIFGLILSVITAYFGSKLRIKSSLDRLLPETTQSVKTLRKVQEKVGSTSNLIIVLESGGFQTNYDFAQKLLPKFEADSLIARVEFRRDVEFIEKNQLLYLSLGDLRTLYTKVKSKIDKEKEKLNPMFVDLDLGFGDEEEDDTSLAEIDEKGKIPDEFYRSEDGKILLIQLYPKARSTNVSTAKKVVKHIQGIVESENPKEFSKDLKIYYGGDFQNKIDNYEVVTNDIFGTLPYGLAFVMLVILLYFWQPLDKTNPKAILSSLLKQIVSILLIVIPLAMSLCWTFGLTYLAIGNLNIITGFLIVILFGLGIDFGVHLYSRYLEERTAGHSQEESLRIMITTTGVATTTSALTTAAAFFSLTINDFKGFSELGFISGVGIIFGLLTMLFILPAFIVAGEKTGAFVTTRSIVNSYEHLNGEPIKWWKKALFICSIITVFSIGVLPNIEFEYDFTNLRADVATSNEGKAKIKQVFKDASDNSPVFVLANTEEIKEIKQVIEEKIKTDTLSPTIKKIKTIEKAVPFDQLKKIRIIKKLKRLVEDDAADLVKGKDKERLDRLRKAVLVTEPITIENVPFNIKKAFIGKDKSTGEFAYIYPSVPMKDGKNAINFADDIREITIPSGKTFYTSGNPIIFADLLLLMEQDVEIAIAFTLGMVFLLLLIDLRNLKSTFFVLIPLLVGISWMAGVMWLTGMKLNFYNMVVLPSIIGIGIDDGVHIYLRYREENRTSLKKVFFSTAKVISVTSLTTAIGFASLTLAHHKGLNSMGYLAVTGIAASLLASAFFLPSILQFLENRRMKTENK
ncbi:MAG: hypothetical protein DWQ06_05635 [Calditrichaeota bacterium]|nr:MAG: hypothetical protein DWQ06_05635 [Calditrichota bacterium]